MASRPTPLDTRVPPPVLVVLLACAMSAASRQWPQAGVALPFGDVLAIAIGFVGLTLNVLPKRRFSRDGTTVNPMRPERSTALVVDGLHRWSRNPMYVGHALILVGMACWWRLWPAMLGPAFYVAYITRFQIIPEERALSARFGGAYDAYRARVRRWL